MSDYDIPVEPSTGDNGYLQQVEKAIQLCLEFEPDLVLYQAGVDGLETDSLGKLSVSRNGMMRRNEMVFNSIFEAQSIPIVVFMGVVIQSRLSIRLMPLRTCSLKQLSSVKNCEFT